MEILLAAGPDPGFGGGDWLLAGAALAGLLAASALLARGPRARASYGRREHAGFMALLGFLAFLVSQPWFYPSPERGGDPTSFYLVIGVQRLFVAVLAVLACRGLLPETNPMRIGVPQSWKRLLWSVGFYAVTLPFVLLLGRIEDRGLVQESARQLAETGDDLQVAAMFLAIVVAAPLFEEVVFRGFFQGSLRRVVGPEIGVMVSTILFTVVHPVALYPQILALGAILGIVYERTRSLWAPVLVHALHNGLVFGYILFLLPEHRP